MGGRDFVLCIGLLATRTMLGVPDAYEKGRSMHREDPARLARCLQTGNGSGGMFDLETGTASKGAEIWATRSGA
jgi:hypothetical protein